MPKPAARTKQQNSAIHALLNKHGFASDDKAEMVYDITGGRTEHTSEMNFEEANVMIKRLGGTPVTQPLADSSRRTVQHHRQRSGVEQIITPTMKDFIHTLRRQRGMSEDGLKAICQRTIKVDFPKTTGQGNRIVEALKSMIKRDAEKNSSEPKEVA